MESKLLYIHAKPKSHKNRIGGWIVYNSRKLLSVYVVDPPENGRANQAIVALLADYLNVPKSTIGLVQGYASRYKIFKIEPWDATLEEKLCNHQQMVETIDV